MTRRLCECGTCARCRHREDVRKWSAANREKVRERQRDYYRRNAVGWNAGRDSQKHRARLAVYTEVRAGRMEKGPCEVGEDCVGRLEAHHDDYGKPLDIRWLCQRHHALLHVEQATALT